MTMWAQQHRQPSPAHPWSESFVVWVEKRQAGGENKSHAKISVAARSRTKTVTTLRTVGQSAMEPYAFYSATRARQTDFPSAIKVLDAAGYVHFPSERRNYCFSPRAPKNRSQGALKYMGGLGSTMYYH